MLRKISGKHILIFLNSWHIFFYLFLWGELMKEITRGWVSLLSSSIYSACECFYDKFIYFFFLKEDALYTAPKLARQTLINKLTCFSFVGNSSSNRTKVLICHCSSTMDTTMTICLYVQPPGCTAFALLNIT